MIAQVTLTAALLAVLAYSFAQRIRLRWFRLFVASICAVGVVIIWDPALATSAANAVNIGRGADLITYLWIALSFAVTVNVHLRLKVNDDRMTRLAREIAILNASRKSAFVPGEDSGANPEVLPSSSGTASLD